MEREETIALLRRARAGSNGALGELLDRCAPKLLGRIRLRLGPSLRARLESRDILQTTLLKGLERVEQFRGGGATSLLAWLSAIADHEIRDQADFHRRQRRDAGRELSLDPPSRAFALEVRSALSRLVWSEEQQRLEEALEALSPAHREVIVLRKLEELPWTEVGDRLGKSPDACRMLFARGMSALALALEAEPVGERPPGKAG